MTLHLYELTPAIKQLVQLMEQEEEGGDPDAWTASLDELEGQFNDKALGLARLIKAWEAEELACKREMDRLQGRMNAAQGKQEWAKRYLKGNMEDVGVDHIKDDIIDVRLQNSGPSVIVEDPDQIPAAYYHGTMKLPWAQVVSKKLVPQAEKVLDKRAILNAHAGDVPVPGARVEKNKYVRIR